MKHDKRIPTVDELVDVYIAKMGYYSNEQRGVAREAFKAGRREGMRYPYGRKAARDTEHIAGSDW